MNFIKTLILICSFLITFANFSQETNNKIKTDIYRGLASGSIQFIVNQLFEYTIARRNLNNSIQNRALYGGTLGLRSFTAALNFLNILFESPNELIDKSKYQKPIPGTARRLVSALSVYYGLKFLANKIKV